MSLSTQVDVKVSDLVLISASGDENVELATLAGSEVPLTPTLNPQPPTLTPTPNSNPDATVSLILTPKLDMLTLIHWFLASSVMHLFLIDRDLPIEVTLTTTLTFNHNPNRNPNRNPEQQRDLTLTSTLNLTRKSYP